MQVPGDCRVEGVPCGEETGVSIRHRSVRDNKTLGFHIFKVEDMNLRQVEPRFKLFFHKLYIILKIIS